MDERRFERLREELLAAGVAARHVRRAIAELRSHVDGWAEDAVARGAARSDAVIEAHAALGSDEDIVARFAAQPGLKAWSARRPALWFLTLPTTAFLTVAVASMVILLGTLEHWPALHRMSVPAQVTRKINTAVQIGLLVALPLSISAVFAMLAHRQRLPLRWPVLGIFVLCLLVSTINVGFEVTGGEHAGVASAGIGTSVDSIGPQLLHALGLALPVILVMWVAQRRAGYGRLRSH